ncbi:hypothetical protein QR685DRAFT_61201 [Neurospora intermedia]|uniref:Uncharacterized protein n=1 Tax=Neurospora intermedia TaxID=5142 RepID=A0ABR3DT85_NEUIN
MEAITWPPRLHTCQIMTGTSQCPKETPNVLPLPCDLSGLISSDTSASSTTPPTAPSAPQIATNTTSTPRDNKAPTDLTILESRGHNTTSSYTRPFPQYHANASSAHEFTYSSPSKLLSRTPTRLFISQCCLPNTLSRFALLLLADFQREPGYGKMTPTVKSSGSIARCYINRKLSHYLEFLRYQIQLLESLWDKHQKLPLPSS